MGSFVRPRVGRRWLVPLIACACACACGASYEDDPSFEYVPAPVFDRAGSVTLRTTHPDWVAAGTTRYMSDVIDRLWRHGSEAGEVDYSWLPDSYETAPCYVEGSTACRVGTRVFSPLLTHEPLLVSGALVWQRPERFIELGLGQVIARTRPLARDVEHARAMLGYDRTHEVDLGVAARVVAHAIAESIRASQNVVWAADEYSTGAEVASFFERQYDVPFEQFVANAFADPCLAVFDPICDSAPELAWRDDGTVTLESELTVAGPRVVGLTATQAEFDEQGHPKGRFWVPRTLRVDAPFEFDISPGHRVELTSCECYLAPTWFAEGTGVANLEPGLYALKFATNANDSGPGSVTLTMLWD